tara:strand:- start:2852 stop:3961 length:1110 start_codon:yes stop_codon:yes gene_type:complete
LKITAFKRIFTAYKTIGTTFGSWFAPVITGLLVCIIRILVVAGRILDRIFFPKAFTKTIKNPIMIVGNPRSGTTFIHRYLVNNDIGTGNQLWQMLYPSLILQKLLRPILPFLEKVSPARHHSTAAHATSLQSVETDDVAIFFRYLDGFFLYGFVLSWAEEDLFEWMDPKIRNMSKRDYAWLESLWIRNQYTSGIDRIIGKLFSLSTNLPEFLETYPDSKILYTIRDPLSVIPSGLNLVSGVLDKRFGFWSLPEEKRQHFINRLYFGLVHLLKRFHEDWENGRIDRSRVYIIHFDRMMNDFDTLMDEILNFIDHVPSEELRKDILKTAETQRNFQSGHKYDLEKFGLTEEQIRLDCAPIYETFLDKEPNA